MGTYSIFATFPAQHFKSWIGPFFDQVIGTAFLVGLIFAITDEFHAPVKSNLAPLIVGFIIVAIGLSYGTNSGYAINPARDFGLGIWAWITGWKSIAFRGDTEREHLFLDTDHRAFRGRCGSRGRLAASQDGCRRAVRVSTSLSRSWPPGRLSRAV